MLMFVAISMCVQNQLDTLIM